MRERILDAASRLFLQYGYKRTTVDEIAAEAGVAKGSVYLHFESKEAIFGAASQLACGRVLDAMAAGAAGDGPADQRLHELLLGGMLAIWDFCHQAPHSPTLWVEVVAAADRYSLPAREEGRKIIAGVVADGQAAGVFSREMDADSLSRLIQLAVQGFEPPFLLIGTRRQFETLLPQLIELIIRGLRAPMEKGN